MKFLSLLLLLLLSTSGFAQVRRGAGADLPAGMVMAHAGQSCPTGFLKADGALILRAAYPALYASIGGAHGSGNGTTNFNLPDYRGLFLRMVDETKGNDVDKASRTAMNAGGAVGNAVGSVQVDAFGSHFHDMLLGAGGFTYAGGPNSDIVGYNYAGGAPWNTSTDMNTVNAGGSESRPKNAYVIYCVKY